MKIKIITGDLHLPGPGAAVAYVGLSKATDASTEKDAIRELLELGLSQGDIDQLKQRIEVASTADRIADSWPTVADDRKVLQAGADMAFALSQVLANASPRAMCEFETAALQTIGQADVSGIARDLAALAIGVINRINKMPDQSRRQSPVRIVRAVHEVVGDRLGAVTKTPEARFRRACVAAFKLAGRRARDGSPDRAIEALAKSLAER